MTIRDIARQVGISIGTVSHVLTHSDKVALATRLKVEHAMRQMRWQPSVAAQQLRRAATHPAGDGHGIMS